MTSLPEEQVYEREPRRRGAALIIGTGAVGGYLAVALARLGISPLRLVDRDVLSVENLIRHPLGAQDIGQPKAPALARRIRSDFPNCNAFGDNLDFMALDEPQQIALLSQASVVVAATDSIDCQQRINELCVKNQVAALYPGVWAMDEVRDGEVSELLHVVPGEGTPCYQCYTSWRPQAGGAESRGGSGADLEQFALVVAWAVISLLHPDDPHADTFDPERTLTLIHNNSSPSPSIAHLFRNGNIQNLRVPFPSVRCPVCGGQEDRLLWPPPPLVSAPPPSTAPVPPRTPAPQPTSPAIDLSFFRARAAWFFGTIGVLLVLLGIEEGLHLWGNTPKILFWGGLDLILVGYGLYRAVRNANMSEILFGFSEAFRNRDVSEILYGFYRAFRYRDASYTPGPAMAWTAVAAAIVLLILGSIVLAEGGQPAVGAGGQSGYSGQPAPASTLPETASTAFKVNPAFVSKGVSIAGLAEDNAGDQFHVSLSPSLSGFTLDVEIKATHNASQYAAGTPASTLTGQSCMDIKGPTTQDGSAGETYTEPPIDTSLTDSGGTVAGTLAYTAVLPGSYSFDLFCLGSDSPDGPLGVGSITTTNLGISDGDNTSDGYNAMTVFAENKSATDTVIIFGAVGSTKDALPPRSSSCIIHNAPQQDPQITRPASVSISEQRRGNGQWYELGSLTFNLSASQISNGTPAYDAVFFYDCTAGKSSSDVISQGGGVTLH